MSIRLHEVHPALVQFPIVILPLSLGADAIGKVTGNRTLLRTGQVGMALTAVSGVVAGIFGLIAQEEVELRSERASDLLVTHRTMNLGFVGLATLLAWRRARRRRPSLRYLAAGAASLGAVAYSAYLGGKLVFQHGVGVEAADGIAEGHGAELRWDRAEELTGHAIEDARRGARHAAERVASGDLLPSLRGDRRAERRRAADGPQP